MSETQRGVLSSDLKRIEERGRFQVLRHHVDTEGKEPLFAALTMFNWSVGTVLAEVVKLFAENVTTVRFEDLRSKPIQTLTCVEEQAGISLAETKAKLENSEPLSTGIGVKGSHMRRENRSVRFQTGMPSTSLPILTIFSQRSLRRL